MDFHNHPEMEPDPELVKPLLTPLLTISNRDFKEKYGIMSGSWRGKNRCNEMRFWHLHILKKHQQFQI